MGTNRQETAKSRHVCVTLCSAVVLMAAALIGCAAPDQAAGTARAIDGDTLVVAGIGRVRIWGIDAPESAQECADAAGAAWACGKEATRALGEIIRAGGPVSCTPKDRDRYGRQVATCAAGGRDLGREMVAAGMAVDYRRYSSGAYAEAEAEARAAGRGIWAGKFERPEKFRREKRRSGP